MSRDVMDAPLTPLEGAPVSNTLSEQFAMAPAVPFAGINDSNQALLPQVDMFDSDKDITAQTKELAPKLIPNSKPNSETAPDRPRDSETAPDRPRDSETAPDRPRDSETAPDRPSDDETAPDRPSDSETAPDRPNNGTNTRVTLGPDGTIRSTVRELGDAIIEGNSQEMGSQVMKNFERYRQWLKAHPPNIKLL